MKIQTIQTIHGTNTEIPSQRAKRYCNDIGHDRLVEKFGRDRVDNIRATVFDVDMGLHGFQSHGSIEPTYSMIGHLSIAEARYLCQEMVEENHGSVLIPIHLSGTSMIGNDLKIVDAMAFVYGYYKSNGDIAFLSRTMGASESTKLVSLRRDAVRHESSVWDPDKAKDYADSWTYAEGLYLGPAAIVELESVRDSFQKTLETLVDVFDGGDDDAV